MFRKHKHNPKHKKQDQMSDTQHNYYDNVSEDASESDEYYYRNVRDKKYSGSESHRYREREHRHEHTRYHPDENESYDSDSDSLSPPLTTKKEYKQSDLDLHRIYLQNVRVPSNVLIVGPKHSGKTTILKHILLNVCEYISSKSCVVTSDTRDYDKLGLDRDVWNVTTAYDMNDSLDNYSVRIVEDISIRTREDEEIFDLYKNKRSLNIIALDRYSSLPSRVRKSIDYVILLGNIRELRDIWFDLGGLVKYYSDFKLIYDGCTNGYDFLVIDNFGSSHRVEEHFKWGRINLEDLHRVRYPAEEYKKPIKNTASKRKSTPYRRDKVSKSTLERSDKYSSPLEKLLDEEDEYVDEPQLEEKRTSVSSHSSPKSSVTDISDSVQRSLVINKAHDIQEHRISQISRERFRSEPVGQNNENIRRYSIRQLNEEVPSRATLVSRNGIDNKIEETETLPPTTQDTNDNQDVVEEKEELIDLVKEEDKQEEFIKHPTKGETIKGEAREEDSQNVQTAQTVQNVQTAQNTKSVDGGEEGDGDEECIIL
jgi:hypothetical protein